MNKTRKSFILILIFNYNNTYNWVITLVKSINQAFIYVCACARNAEDFDLQTNYTNKIKTNKSLLKTDEL